ncbi:unnamed protein product, partial [Oppiella nova]
MLSTLIGFIALTVWSERVQTSLDRIRADVSGELARSQNINISDLLDQILLGYDNHIRPDFGGPPTQVFIDFHVRSMGPISEIDMTYVMDCYFRQTWTDTRLSYKTRSLMEMNANQTLSPPALALSIYMLDKIWKPPTYFLNSRQSHMHVITLPNKFVRIYSDGKVLYSSSQLSNELGQFSDGYSVGYSMEEVVYSWNPARKVVINPDMKMSQFDLIAVPVGNKTNDERKDGPYSILLASFHFQRHMGSFVIEVYAPCIMLVVLSWVSFWINREATADRITLGLTTVLTMTFMSLELRNDLPKVPYLTALDYFVYISFAFISATILEFGFVHFFTKIGIYSVVLFNANLFTQKSTHISGSGEYYFSPTSFMQLNNSPEMDDYFSSDEEYEDYDGYEDGAHSVTNVRTTGLGAETSKGRRDVRDETKDNDCIHRVRDFSHKESPVVFHRQQSEIYSTERDRGVIVLKRDDNTDAMSSGSSSQMSAPQEPYEYDYDLQEPTTSTFRCSDHLERQWSATTARERDERQMSRLSSIRASIRNTFSRKKSRRRQSVSLQLNSVSKIDRISRVIFPLAFLIMN